MRKNVFLICCLLLFMSACFEDCKSPAAPEPDDPWQYGGEIEILLETDRNIDFTKTAISVYHTTYGGKNASYWTSAGEGKWLSSISLNCDPQPYFLMTIGYNLTTENFYLRRKGDVNWLKLTCITDAPLDSRYKALKFLFNNGQIQNPSGCLSS